MPRLLTLNKAADALGVPVASLRGAAERHGYLIRMGRVVRINPNDLGVCAAEVLAADRLPVAVAELVYRV